MIVTPMRLIFRLAANPLCFALGLLIVPAAGAASDDGWPGEISGAARLPDGRLVFVDDESPTTIWIWNGDAASEPETLAIPRAMDDLEGVAADSTGHVYLLTSHSLTKRGVARADRRRLARLDIPPAAGGKGGYSGAKPAMVSADNLLEPLCAALATTPAALNLEGLAWYPPANLLFCGVREPLAEGRLGLVATLRVEVAFGAASGDSAVSGVRRLDLGGRGIRGLDFDPWRRGIVVLAGPAGDAERGPFGLYFWDPEADRVTPFQAPELAGVTLPEGVVALGPPEADGGSPILVAAEGSAPVRIRAVLAPDHNARD